ncbi:MAG: glycine cleavage system aminomethyltransferase GcvT [Bdellovibrionaceae bacterium]|nr:glycine cleavage system aminomethyltransferase GcvT [Pseudobdellovibrionaceae bacterium]
MDSSTENKKTPLNENHKKRGAKMVGFAGWEMPIQYTQLKDEHRCVRTHVGLFDVSHMGEIRIQGPQALATLQWLTTNDVAKLSAGQAQYSLLPNSTGGLVDDIIVYCLKEDSDYLVCVNASNKDKDFDWMIKNNKGAKITDESDQWGQIAVQGPKAHDLLKLIFNEALDSVKNFSVLNRKFTNSHGHLVDVIIATTGYTGERGAEIFVPWSETEDLWNTLLDKGQSLGVQPIGLGARDTLRTEMKYSLYGHEINDEINPYESGLGWAIKPDAKDFMGRSAILKGREQGLKRKLVGLKMLDKGIPRENYLLFSKNGEQTGWVTSGTHSPTLDTPIGIGYVSIADSEIGNEIFVDIRGRKVKAQVCKTPFIP